jgi:hypothetical protein
MALTLASEPSPNVIVAHRERTDASNAPTAPSVSKTKPVPPPTLPTGIVDFSKQIKPMLERSCIGCHSGPEAKGGFRVTTRELLIKGGESGEAAILLDGSGESPLLGFVSDEVEDLEMPPLAKRAVYPPLTKEQIDQLRTWIEKGAPWPNGVVLKPAE